MATTIETDFRTASASAAAPAAVAYWLFACCGLVFAMVVVGGITRLTGSGLSMVEWRPVYGVLPPLSGAEWQRIFDLYQAFPQYRELSEGMTLAEFRAIFWWEYIHRVLGRLIGAVFAIPFVWFALRRQLSGALAGRLALIFLLGGAQGLMGWYMVKSGLVDVPWVSPYRLTAHLALAVLLYGWLLWTALSVKRKPPASVADDRLPGVVRLARIAAAAVVITLLSGGFMAGSDAGWTYNTFPLIDGNWFPRGYFILDPWFANPFENIAAIHFNHRWLAIATLCLALAVWWRSRWLVLAPATRRLANWLALTACVQVALGITTLLLVVPTALAVLHQATALALLSFALMLVYDLSGARQSP